MIRVHASGFKSALKNASEFVLRKSLLEEHEYAHITFKLLSFKDFEENQSAQITITSGPPWKRFSQTLQVVAHGATQDSTFQCSVIPARLLLILKLEDDFLNLKMNGETLEIKSDRTFTEHKIKAPYCLEQQTPEADFPNCIQVFTDELKYFCKAVSTDEDWAALTQVAFYSDETSDCAYAATDAAKLLYVSRNGLQGIFDREPVMISAKAIAQQVKKDFILTTINYGPSHVLMTGRDGQKLQVTRSAHNSKPIDLAGLLNPNFKVEVMMEPFRTIVKSAISLADYGKGITVFFDGFDSRIEVKNEDRNEVLTYGFHAGKPQQLKPDAVWPGSIGFNAKVLYSVLEGMRGEVLDVLINNDRSGVHFQAQSNETNRIRGIVMPVMQHKD